MSIEQQNRYIRCERKHTFHIHLPELGGDLKQLEISQTNVNKYGTVSKAGQYSSVNINIKEKISYEDWHINT